MPTDVRPVDPNTDSYTIAALLEDVRKQTDATSAMLLLRDHLGRSYAAGFRAGHMAGLQDALHASLLNQNTADQTADQTEQQP